MPFIKDIISIFLATREKIRFICEKSRLEGDRMNNLRFGLHEGLALYDLPLHELGKMADEKKRQRFGNEVTFIKNYYMNFTNICRYACKYCGFRRNKTDADAYVLGLDAIEKKLASAPEQLKEVWFSSGLNPELPYQYYLDLLQLVKRIVPDAMIKAFTAVEIDFFAKKFGKSYEEVIDDFVSHGLGRIPGGGAEIFDDAIRKKIDIKIRAQDYFRIHELMHQRDIPTSITMLFGHIEKREHRIAHMLAIRDFQDRSKGVQAFIPLAFQDKNNPLALRGVKGPSAVEVLKTLAISRIILDNVDHIQSFWIDSGVEVTQISLHFGVDDLNGTMIEENIAHESGAKTKKYETADSLVDWIHSSGFVAVERDCRFMRLSSELRS